MDRWMLASFTDECKNAACKLSYKVAYKLRELVVEITQPRAYLTVKLCCIHGTQLCQISHMKC